MGDDPGYKYPDSLFAFAHLGTEVSMKRKPVQNIVKNNYIPQYMNMKAFAKSSLPDNKIGQVPKATQVPLWMTAVQYIPLAGWMFSHFPGMCRFSFGPLCLHGLFFLCLIHGVLKFATT
jgi:hypothetical protein